MSNFPRIQADQGVTRQVLSENEAMMLVSFQFEKDAVGKLHNHVHVQSSYIKSGRFLYVIDGVETEVGVGDSVIIPSNVMHGCTCLEAGELIDCFSPRRDDFLLAILNLREQQATVDVDVRACDE